jgi:hypothetical protein
MRWHLAEQVPINTATGRKRKCPFSVPSVEPDWMRTSYSARIVVRKSKDQSRDIRKELRRDISSPINRTSNRDINRDIPHYPRLAGPRRSEPQLHFSTSV